MEAFVELERRLEAALAAARMPNAPAQVCFCLIKQSRYTHHGHQMGF